MGLVVPHDGYLEGLRALADEYDALLVFDEVITGFRLGPGGAQERFGVRADLVLLGKVLGGGMPIGAVAGPEGLMDQLAPVGPVYQAGTLAGNPVAMAAGIAALTTMAAQPDFHDRLQNTARSLVRGIVDAADTIAKVPVYAAAVGGLAGIFFSEEEVSDLAQATATDAEVYASFHRGMLERGVFLPPSRFEALFLTSAHTEAHIDRIVEATHDALATV